MTTADRDRWEPRWRAASGPVPAPDPWLAANLDLLPPGPVLDAACGDGGNALFLAGHGRAVTAIDIAPAAIARLEAEAAGRGLAVATRVADLDVPGALAGLGPFAAIVMARFAPSPAQWRALLGVLAPGGRVLHRSFGRAHHERTGFPLEYCLARAALEALLSPPLRLVRHDSDGAMEGYVWELG